MKQLKLEFSEQFVKSLRGFYGGRIPSFASIARDFSLRAPHLPHVSAETIRQWARGAAVPHVSRMQVLVDWLGSDVAASFDRHSRILLSGKPGPQSNGLHNGHDASNGESTNENSDQNNLTDTDPQRLLQLMSSLTAEEQQAIFEIAALFAARHSNDQN